MYKWVELLGDIMDWKIKEVKIFKSTPKKRREEEKEKREEKKRKKERKKERKEENRCISSACFTILKAGWRFTKTETF